MSVYMYIQIWPQTLHNVMMVSFVLLVGVPPTRGDWRCVETVHGAVSVIVWECSLGMRPRWPAGSLESCRLKVSLENKLQYLVPYYMRICMLCLKHKFALHIFALPLLCV